MAAASLGSLRKRGGGPRFLVSGPKADAEGGGRHLSRGDAGSPRQLVRTTGPVLCGSTFRSVRLEQATSTERQGSDHDCRPSAREMCGVAIAHLLEAPPGLVGRCKGA